MSEEAQQHIGKEDELEEAKHLLEAHRQRKRPLWARITRFVFRMVMVLLVLLLMLRWIVSYPVVQNKLVTWMTGYLSNQLQTEVKIDYINFSFFDEFLMEGFLIEDLDSDTILYAEELKADIAVFSILRRETHIDNLSLKNAQFNMIAPKGDKFSNLQFIFDRFFPPGPPQPPTPEKPITFDFNIKKVTLDNLSAKIYNHYNGILMDYFVDKGHFYFDYMSLKDKEMVIDQIDINGLEAIYVLDTVFADKVIRAQDTIQYEQYIDTFPRTAWSYEISQLKLRDSDFHFVNLVLPFDFPEEDFNYSDMKYSNINMDIRHLRFADNELKSKLRKLSLMESKGLVLEELSGDLLINGELAMLSDMKFITPDSYLQDTLAFKYKKATDWNKFEDKVKMDFKLTDSELAVKDLLYIAPILKENPFFSSNIDEKIKISGRIYDKVNRLKGNDLKLQIGRTKLIGKFRSTDLPSPSDATLNLDLKQLSTNMENVQLLLKDVKLPEQLMRLGNLNFSGRMDGFLLQFTTKGRLKSDLGIAQSNMTFDLKSGKNYGSYDGKFGVKEFDLGTFLGNTDLGDITFDADFKGKGFSIDKLNAELEGKINDITYKDYTYRDIKIDGISKPNLFDGVLGIDDENIKVTFNGEVDFNDTLPRFDLHTKFDYVDLKPLNLIDLDYRLEGDVQLKFEGIDPNEIDGFAAVHDFKLYNTISRNALTNLPDSIETYELDSLRLTSGVDGRNARFYTVKSELMTGTLLSNFNLINVQDVLLNYLNVYFPKFTTALDLSNLVKGDSSFVYKPVNPAENEYYYLSLDVEDSKNWTELISAELGQLKKCTVESRFESKSSRTDVEGSTFNFKMGLPNFKFGDIQFGLGYVDITAIEDSCGVIANLDNAFIGDSLDIPSIELENTIQKDLFKFKVDGEKIGGIAQNIKLQGEIEALDDMFKIHIDTSDFIIYNREWSISQGNEVAIYDNRIVPEDVRLYNSLHNESISLSSFGRKGLQLDISNLSLDWIEEFVDLEGYQFKGRANGKVTIKDIFNAQNLKAQVAIDTLMMNDLKLGKATAVVAFPDLNSPISINAVIRDKRKSRFSLAGTYTAPNIESNFRKDHYFNFKIEARNYPLKIIENFVGDFVSRTEGDFDGDIIAAGTPTKPEMSGNIRVSKVGLMVDYLQTFYRIDKATVKITNNAFIIKGSSIRGNSSEGCMVKDKEGNIAFVTGAVLHNSLQNFAFDITMTSPKFLLLDTDRNSPEMFYGKAIGDVTLKVTGSLDNPDININATSLKGTKVVIPVTSESSASEVKFIKFTNELPDSTEEETNYQTPNGLNVDMTLNVTPDAVIRLIFDESVGDEIQGQGNGSLKIGVDKFGNFKMEGIYTITQGEYLFTYQNFINKPFVVGNGGTIEWTGDPFDATLNLTAYYRNLKVAPYNFILEYLNTDDERAAAQKSSSVDLKMYLRGALFNPDISFDLEFPVVDNAVESYVESKLKLTREDENELNRQVFGLIVLGDFLPSNAAGATTGSLGGIAIATGLNTVTEMLSNQFSMYVSDLLSEVVGDYGWISSIDVDVNYKRAEFEDIDAITFGNEVGVGLKSGFINDRIVISGNVNFDDASNQYTGDFELEWIMTPDGRWRVRLYNRNEVVRGNDRTNRGVTLTYQREFDTVKELFENMVKKEKERQDN